MDTIDQGVIYAIIIFYGVICQLINILGVVTNIINIICFVKQGFRDSVNVTLLGLTVADLGSLVSTCASCFCVMYNYIYNDLPYELMEIAYISVALLHLSFTRVSACITAVITIERCVCITMPLKVKSLITPERSAVVTVCVFIVFLFSNSPVYAVNKLDMKFSVLRNKTVLGLVSTDPRGQVETISFIVNNFMIPFSAFIIITICTAILVFQLHSKAKWRKTASTNSEASNSSSRNIKAARMVVTISILFIVCFVPDNVVMLVMAFDPSFSVNGKNLHLSLLMGGVAVLLESINSSLNTFIYYRMGSKFKDTFMQVFRYSKKVY